MTPPNSKSTPLPTADNFDLDRYMGDWYVHGHIPLLPERNAFNAVESYSLEDDGSVRTVYAYRDGGFNAEVKIMTPTGFVESDDGAEWSMRFIWPFKAEYLISHLDDEHSEVIVARNRRDYVWIMGRDRSMADVRYEGLLQRVASFGYDADDVRRVPQRWPDPKHPADAQSKSMADR